MKHPGRMVLAAALALTLAGCSGSGSGAASSTSRSGTSTAATAGESPSPASQPSPSTSSSAPAESGSLPTAAELAQARKDVSTLPTQRLAAQLVIGFYKGRAPADAAAAIRGQHLGGVILFDNNVPQEPDQVVPTLRSTSAAAQQAMKDDGRDWPAIVSVDQEGGPVARIGTSFTELPAGMAYGAADDTSLSTRVAEDAGQELRALGVTMVFGPDADVTVGPADPTIGVRSPGSDRERVARTAAAQVQGYTRAGVIPVVKHFPGHGSVTTDSHVGLPVQHAGLATLKQRDLVPFQRLVETGAPAVMSAHIVLQDVDPSAPATMSRPVLTGLLRQQMGFQGLVITDALQMGAITQRYGSARAAVTALQAGADVLLMPADAGAAVQAVTKAVASGELSRDRLVVSAARIVATLRHASATQPPASVVGSHHADALRLARASVTQLSGPCGKRLVGPSVAVSGGTATDRARFTAAARHAGLGTSGGTSVRLLGGGVYNAGTGEDTGARSGTGDVLISLDTPYGLKAGPESSTRLAAFGRTPETFEALVGVLTGTSRAHGTLPVAVGAWKVGAGCS